MVGTFLLLASRLALSQKKERKEKEKSHLRWRLESHLEDSGKVPWEGSTRDSLLRSPCGDGVVTKDFPSIFVSRWGISLLGESSPKAEDSHFLETQGLGRCLTL